MGQDYGASATKALSGEKAAVHSGVPYYVVLRHGKYKYIRYLGADEPAELYDLNSDPEELINLAANEKFRETKDRLHKRLRDELTRCDAAFLEVFDRVSATR
jgi:arylsulfatase A-like enzyme